MSTLIDYVFRCQVAQSHLLGIGSSNNAIGVFIGSSLVTGVWLGKKYISIQGFCHLLMGSELASVI